jgi:hypothetical protein
MEADMVVMKTMSLVLLLCLVVGTVQAQKVPKLEGAWELVSQKVDGKDHPFAGRQIKLLSKSHYMWVRQDKKTLMGLLAKNTVRDSLRAYQDTYGAGTYKVSGNTYLETTEFFYEPSYIGTSVHFTFKFDGPRWIIMGTIPQMKGDKKIGEEQLEEVWKRSE